MGDLSEVLWALAACDEKAGELTQELAQIPGLIEEAEAQAQAARAVIEEERRALEEAEHTRRTKERELQECEAKRAKFQSQTALVKTNAEYTALLNEIEGLSLLISQMEEEILLAMEASDQISARIETVEQEQTELERDLLDRADQLRQRMVAAKDEIEAREKEREELLAPQEPRVRALYERLREARGTATARVQGGSCAACHRQVPPEKVNRALAGELQTCPSCQRILVVGPV